MDPENSSQKVDADELNADEIKTPQRKKSVAVESPEKVAPIEISWDMFAKEGAPLGEGAYGTVYKVRSLLSTKLGSDGNERVLISQKSMRKAAADYAAQKRKVGSLITQGGKQILKDQYYVIKEVDVDGLPEHKQEEALVEIETLQQCESAYIVGYIDSFLDGSRVNLVLEYCPLGDLCGLISRQKKLCTGTTIKPFVDNVIWKIFMNICLGVQYLHDKGWIHRDIKTLNVFMLKDYWAKIGDFGTVIPISTLEENKEGAKKQDEKDAEEP